MQSSNSTDSLASGNSSDGYDNSDDMPRPVPGFVFRHFLHEDAKIGKLMTREDNYHIHKTLGILSLVSFCYRYGYVFNVKGDLGFDGSGADRDPMMVYLDWATMAVHTLLALSSILFRVPRKRLNAKPMVIYEEYRQHAMVFTLRCFFVFAVVMLFPQAQGWLTPLVVMAHHLLADRITSIHGTPGNTAVRATSGSMKLSTFYLGVAKAYSLYQFLAIASHILPNARMGDMAYNAIIAIQSSAFMMTLYRKRIIRGRTHMVVYALCLVLSVFHIVRSLPLSYTALTIGAFFLRIQLPRAISNKYVVWSAFLCAAYYPYLQTLAAQVYEKIVAAPELSSAIPELMDEFPVVKGATTAVALYIVFQGERMLFQEAPEDVKEDKKA
ncbi:hypothetical protein B484DRAFT_176295 [Ochromonadaceae sp. CCMP2298]|nr:hypothetical protein B484DRAFT_176295 [Ochromonadaceae sp. CCMP2298]|mmetsp:Transcript_33855/g.74551  ORF Transcript_33855/g.74551 Transcript_33855/m.74551 type:complete len:383 (-) Transcript_33855:131-1279(-)